jgi:hypothetical protein
MTVHVDDGATAPDAITLEVEDLEEVIAPNSQGTTTKLSSGTRWS